MFSLGQLNGEYVLVKLIYLTAFLPLCSYYKTLNICAF